MKGRRKSNNRITKINEEIRHELSNIIRLNLKDPRVSNLASVIRVETTPDLKHCNVYISTLGNEEVKESTKEGLLSSSGFIRKELAKCMNLRNTPELHFEMDDSIEYGIHMSSLIDETIQHDKQEKKDGN